MRYIFDLTAQISHSFIYPRLLCNLLPISRRCEPRSDQKLRHPSLPLPPLIFLHNLVINRHIKQSKRRDASKPLDRDTNSSDNSRSWLPSSRRKLVDQRVQHRTSRAFGKKGSISSHLTIVRNCYPCTAPLITEASGLPEFFTSLISNDMRPISGKAQPPSVRPPFICCTIQHYSVFGDVFNWLFRQFTE